MVHWRKTSAPDLAFSNNFADNVQHSRIFRSAEKKPAIPIARFCRCDRGLVTLTLLDKGRHEDYHAAHSSVICPGRGASVPDTDFLYQLLTHFGYAALLAVTFLKGCTIVLVAGAVAHQGYLSLPIVMLCSFLGSLAGDEAEYYAGRRYGPAFLAARPRLRKASALIHRLLARYDAAFMLGFRFIYGVRIVTPLLLGLEGVPPVRFFLFNFAGALGWAVLTSLAGYGLSEAAEQLAEDMDGAARLTIVAGMLLAMGIIVWLTRRWRRRSLRPLPLTDAHGESLAD